MAAPRNSVAPDNIAHVQVKFFTKQPQYAVPDSPFSLPINIGEQDLGALINSLLYPDAPKERHIHFDFLIEGEFLRVPLQAYIEQKNLSTELVFDLEYVERHPAPEPEDSLLHDDWVAAVHAQQDYILTGCYDNTVRIWNTEGELITTIPGHGGPVKCVAWVKNDDEYPVKQFVTGSHDESVLIWEWNQQRNSVDCVHTCRGHAASVDCLAVHPSRTKFCSGSWDKLLKLWSTVEDGNDASRGETSERPSKKKRTEHSKVPARTPIMTLSGHNEAISSVQWLSDSEVCTASWDHTIRLWDMAQATQKSILQGNKVFFSVAFSQLSRLLVAASADRHIRLYDPRVTDGAVVKATYTSHKAWTSAVAWSPTNENHFISGSHDNLVKLWDTRSPNAPLFDMSGHEDKVMCVDWSMPQYMLSGGADNCLKVFRYSDVTVRAGQPQGVPND